MLSTLLILGTLGLAATLAGPALRSAQLAAVVTATLVDLTNEDRATGSIGTLTVSPALTAAAQAKADDMAKNGYFAHTSPAGVTSWYWFKQAGYSFSYAGENLAVDFTDSTDVNTAWLDSPTHRANILNGHFTQIGIATAEGMYEGHRTTFVVQMFGKPSSPAPIVRAVQPADPREIATAQTEPKTQVLGAAVQPVPRPVVVTASTSGQQAESPAAASVSAAEDPAPHYAPFWAPLVSAPHKMLRLAYILFGIILALALLLRTGFEFRQHHMKHLVAVIALLVLMSGLFLFADRFVFVEPVLGTAQSI